MHDINKSLHSHCPVLDAPAPYVVDDGVGNVLGDLEDALGPLDALFGVETLPNVGWIEEKENISSSFVESHEKRSRRTSLRWISALHSPRFFFSSWPFLLRNILRLVIMCFLTWSALAEISSRSSSVDVDWSFIWTVCRDLSSSCRN